MLNQTIRINAQPFTIVGVASKGFAGTTMGSTPDVYVPLSFKPLMTPGWNGTTNNYSDYWLYLVGRLKPGATREQAAAALNSLYSGLVEDQAKTSRFRDPNRLQRFRESRLSVIDGSHGKSEARDQGRTPILILQIATG